MRSAPYTACSGYRLCHRRACTRRELGRRGRSALGALPLRGDRLPLSSRFCLCSLPLPLLDLAMAIVVQFSTVAVQLVKVLAKADRIFLQLLSDMFPVPCSLVLSILVAVEIGLNPLDGPHCALADAQVLRGKRTNVCLELRVREVPGFGVRVDLQDNVQPCAEDCKRDVLLVGRLSHGRRGGTEGAARPGSRREVGKAGQVEVVAEAAGALTPLPSALALACA